MLLRDWKILLILMITSLWLVACSTSNEKDIIGNWKVSNKDDTTEGYIEFQEERLIIREMPNDERTSVKYTLVEISDDQFMIEIVNPVSGSEETMLEGYFEDKDTIVPIEDGKSPKLIRGDSIEEDKERLEDGK